MELPGTRKPNSPRKLAFGKSALRRSAAGFGPAQTRKPAPNAELAEALASRPKVDFLDPFMRHAAMQAKGISLCAFLVTLAAFQRGLKVTFHYERASFDPRFARAKMQGHRGELFSISNGSHTHTFSRTLGDLTDPAANAIAEDKHLTKAILKRAGVRTPVGIVAEKSQTALIEQFLARHPGKRFVVKPQDGSLSRGVSANISADEVRDLVVKRSDARLMIEEYISGRECRATIVNGRCIAVSWRKRPVVVGDGISTIRQLILVYRARLGASNPHWDQLKDEGGISQFLARANLQLSSVIERGARVVLSNTAEGCIHHDVTDLIPPEVRLQLEKAAGAVGLPICGIDMIVEGGRVACILELNQRPYIGAHSFPTSHETAGQGNAVAEAIVDFYFPETIRDKTHSALAYDIGPIRLALESAQISELSLPVIGPDWRVLRYVETGIAAKAMVKLIDTAARIAGVFITSAPHPKGGVELCLAYGPNNWRAFITAIPAQFKERLEILAANAT